MSRLTLTIDGRPVEIESGHTVLEAARHLGIDIPTLCYLEKCGPLNSCLVCVVKVRASGLARVVPACGTKVQDGMVVESETPEVHGLRQTALELLLSDHVGDCLSPCHRICPLSLNIPRMIREIEQDLPAAAIATVRHALPLPTILGRLCHAPCEKGCRRDSCDGSASIRDLERHVADTDRLNASPWLPPRKSSTGKSVAIVGAGPAGLSAASSLLRQGHHCTLYDRNPSPGGLLRTSPGLPTDVLDFEIDQLKRLGATFRNGLQLGTSLQLADLERSYDAVLVAVGELAAGEAEPLGMMASPTGLRTNASTGQTASAKVFAAGSAVRPLKQLVRVMAEGQAAAECIHQFLVGLPIRSHTKTFSSVMGRLDDVELQQFLQTASASPPIPVSKPETGFSVSEARQEAARCLHCDCRAAGHCGLQHYAQLYGAQPNRFSRQRRRFTQHTHPANVLFEPGKCILCGICIEIARQAAEPLGLTFVGRGFDVQVAAPLDHPFADGLVKVAADCVAHCPTGAIVFRDG
jgi:ferredoxin